MLGVKGSSSEQMLGMQCRASTTTASCCCCCVRHTPNLLWCAHQPHIDRLRTHQASNKVGLQVQSPKKQASLRHKASECDACLVPRHTAHPPRLVKHAPTVAAAAPAVATQLSAVLGLEAGKQTQQLWSTRPTPQTTKQGDRFSSAVLVPRAHALLLFECLLCRHAATHCVPALQQAVLAATHQHAG